MTFRPRWLLLSMAVVGGLVAGSAMGQSLSADRQVYDYGTVLDGHIGYAQFTLTNTGQANLTITNLSWGCGCIEGATLITAAGQEIDVRNRATVNRALPAGQSIELRVRFNTRGYSRRAQPTTQSLWVNYTDPASRSLSLTLRANVVTSLPAAQNFMSSPTEFVQAHYVLIDLRSASEFAQGHLFGAISIPYADLARRLPQLPRGNTYILYDTDGRQASEAVSAMNAAGHDGRASFINGGLVHWQQDLGDRYFLWAEGSSRQTFRGSPVGSSRAKRPSDVAEAYVVVVDVSAPHEFARAHVPGSINLVEYEVLDWARTLIDKLSLRSKQDLTVWVLDDVGGAASCRIAQRLVTDGFRAKCVQGGRAALEANTGDRILWRP